jgi:hypothetical protein
MAQLEAGDKADFKKFLTAMQRKGRVEAVDQTEAADETGRRLSTCDDTCLYANDGVCDDGSQGGYAWCTCGTDCTDCIANTYTYTYQEGVLLDNAEYRGHVSISGNPQTFEAMAAQCSADSECIGIWQRVSGEYVPLYPGDRSWRGTDSFPSGLPNDTVKQVWKKIESLEGGSGVSCDTSTSVYEVTVDSCLKDVCCAEDKDDCCELNVGAVVGTAIALLVVLVGSILACCKFFPGCPMNKDGGKPAKRSSAPPVYESTEPVPPALAPIKAEALEMMAEETAELAPDAASLPPGHVSGAEAAAMAEGEPPPQPSEGWGRRFASWRAVEEPPPPPAAEAYPPEAELEPEC